MIILLQQKSLINRNGKKNKRDFQQLLRQHSPALSFSEFTRGKGRSQWLCKYRPAEYMMPKQ